MGWMNERERQTAKLKFKVSSQFMCDDCQRPILSIPVVDPKGGYFPKPAGTPDFLPKQPRRTFCIPCNEVKRGKVKTKVGNNNTVRVKSLVGTSKGVRVLAQKMLDLLRANRKNQWQPIEFRRMMRPAFPKKLVREAYDYLRGQKLILRKGGGLRVALGASIANP